MTLTCAASVAVAQAKKLTVDDDDKRAAWKSYTALVSKMCPKQRLTLLPPAVMNLTVEDFEAHQLAPLVNQQYQEIAALSCLNVPGGAACANTGLLVAAQRGHYLDRFAATMCETGLTCTAQSKCKQR